MEDVQSPLSASEALPAALVREELERVLRCPALANSPGLSRLLRFLVDEVLADRGAFLKESYIGHVLYDKSATYDPKVDSTVRVNANRLRLKLASCYGPGPRATVRIEMVRGSYAPIFHAGKAAEQEGDTVEHEEAPGGRGVAWEPGMAPLAATMLLPEDCAARGVENGLPTFRETGPDALHGVLAPPEDVLQRVPKDAGTRSGDDGWLRRQRLLVLAGSGGLLALLLVGYVAMRWASQPAPARWSLRAFSRARTVMVFPAFSPDGTKVAFSMSPEAGGASSAIYVQDVSGEGLVRLTTDEGENSRPAWSPDQGSIAYIHLDSEGRKEVRILSLRDRVSRRLVELPGTFPWLCEVPRLSWSKDGGEIFTTAAPVRGGSCGIVSVNVGSATVQAWTAGAPGSVGDLEPAVSPDGSQVAFLRSSGTLVSDLYVLDRATRETVRVTRDARDVLGFCWRADGRGFVVASRRGEGTSQLWELDREGEHAVSLTSLASNAGFPSMSPGGEAIVFTEYRNQTSIWRVGRDDPQPVVRDASVNVAPAPSPDGRQIVFRSDRTGSLELWSAERDGSHERRLTHMSGSSNNPSWSPDGTTIAFECRDRGNADLCSVPATGGEARHLTNWSSSQVLPAWSRDGSTLFFSSNHSGVWQIYALRKGSEEPTEVTSDGGRRASVLPSGEALLISRDSGGKEIDCVAVPPVAAPGPPCRGAERVRSVLPGDIAGSWDASPRGFWYLVKGGPGETRVMEYDLQEEASHAVTTVHGEAIEGDRSLAVEPDGRSALVVLQGAESASLNLLQRESGERR